MLRSQLGAVPCTLTTRLVAARYPGLLSTAGSGAATANRWAAPMPLNTCGNGPLASSRRNSENMVFAWDGMTLSIVVSTSESSTCLTTTGKDEAVRTEPIAQAISSIEGMVHDGLVIACPT